MTSLILNVVFGSIFILSIKWVQVRRCEDMVTVAAVNYIVAALMIVPVFATRPVSQLSATALATGAAMGASYFVAFFFFDFAIRRIGAASTTVIAVLSILVPIGFGVFLWGEQPNQTQVAGVALALISLYLISRGQSRDRSRRDFDTPKTSDESGIRVAYILIGFFLLAGASRLAQEAFKHLSTPDQRPTYLLAAFVIAAIPSLGILVVRRRGVSGTELAFGGLMGASNILQTQFILKALQTFDGFIVFPVVSAGSLLLTTMVATGLLGETLSRAARLGIATAIAALFLLNYFH